MEVCSYAKFVGDFSGGLEYYCSKYAWRMAIDALDTCKQCPHYYRKKANF